MVARCLHPRGFTLRSKPRQLHHFHSSRRQLPNAQPYLGGSLPTVRCGLYRTVLARPMLGVEMQSMRRCRAMLAAHTAKNAIARCLYVPTECATLLARMHVRVDGDWASAAYCRGGPQPVPVPPIHKTLWQHHSAADASRTLRCRVRKIRLRGWSASTHKEHTRYLEPIF